MTKRFPYPAKEKGGAFDLARKKKLAPEDVYKRQDYALATGVEALFGWLYLNGRQHRVCQLFERIVEEEEKGRNAQ